MSALSEAQPLVRLTAASYSDGLSGISWSADPATIARLLFDQTGEMNNSSGLSALFVSWGQFVDHDLSLTRDASGEHVFAQGLVAPLQRSVYTTDAEGVRIPLNEVTPEMDASMVYGSTAERLAQLRAFEGGALRAQTGADGMQQLCPVATEGEQMAGAGAFDGLYLAGDIRANENTGLLTLHTLMLREHNAWADRLARALPDWDDESLFQAARSIVEAEIQQITYSDWLPLLLGKGDGLPATVTDLLAGPSENTLALGNRISVEFSTAAFRFGHTMVTSKIGRITEDGTDTGSLTVQEAFFNATVIAQGGLSDLLRGQAAFMAQQSDAKVIDDLNMFLTGPDGTTGFSLAALNILRGHDHGMGTYLDVRAALLGDIDPAQIAADDFSVITADPELQVELARVYASVHEVDLWVGGLAEDTVAGGQVGALYAYIIAEQFGRTRASDVGFGVLSNLLPASMAQQIAAEIGQTTLRDVLMRNTDIDYLQRDAFLAAARAMGSDVADTVRGGNTADLLMALGGDDTVRGRDGDDTLYGDAGDDLLFGGQGDDALWGGTGNDVLKGDAGADNLDGGDGADTLSGGAGQDHLLGGQGNDRLSGGTEADFLDGGAGEDDLSGGAGADTLHGSAGGDRIKGDAGDDLLIGGHGNDVLRGGTGNDIATGGNGQDRLLGGDGDDELKGGRDADILLGGAGADALHGNAGDDRLDGGNGDDRLLGGAGRDVLRGGGDNDHLSGYTGGDLLFGGSGDDTLWGGSGHDKLRGEDGSDTLSGGGNDDRLDGGAGADRLDGGAGRDILIGGSGADCFVFAQNAGHDRIDDFETGIDTLDLRDFGLPGFLQVEQTMDQTGRHVLLTLDHGASVLIRNTDHADLTEDHFLLT